MSARSLRSPLGLLLPPLLWLAACAEGEGDEKAEPGGDTFSYPLDDTLRPTDLQALGTHNSYHVEMPSPFPQIQPGSGLPKGLQIGANPVHKSVAAV
jgi:hypothetical protein